MPVATVGDIADATMTITPAEIEAYADLVGDTNPIHVDDDYAEATMFDGRVAHGMLSAGVVSAALADLPGDVVYLAQDLAFEAPVRPGDTVTATAEVIESLGNDQLRVETTVTTGTDGTGGDGDATTVLSGEATVMSIPHDPTPPAKSESETDVVERDATTDRHTSVGPHPDTEAESCDD